MPTTLDNTLLGQERILRRGSGEGPFPTYSKVPTLPGVVEEKPPGRRQRTRGRGRGASSGAMAAAGSPPAGDSASARGVIARVSNSLAGAGIAVSTPGLGGKGPVPSPLAPAGLGARSATSGQTAAGSTYFDFQALISGEVSGTKIVGGKRHAATLPAGIQKTRLEKEVVCAEYCLKLSKADTLPLNVLQAAIEQVRKLCRVPMNVLCVCSKKFCENLVAREMYAEAAKSMRVWSLPGETWTEQNPHLGALAPKCVEQPNLDLYCYTFRACFCNDKVLALFAEPLDGKDLGAPYKLCEATLCEMEKVYALDDTLISVLPDEFVSMSDEICKIARAVVAVSSPVPGYLGSSYKDARDILADSGEQGTEETDITVFTDAMRTMISKNSGWRARVSSYWTLGQEDATVALPFAQVLSEVSDTGVAPGVVSEVPRPDVRPAPRHRPGEGHVGRAGQRGGAGGVDSEQDDRGGRGRQAAQGAELHGRRHGPHPGAPDLQGQARAYEEHPVGQDGDLTMVLDVGVDMLTSAMSLQKLLKTNHDVPDDMAHVKALIEYAETTYQAHEEEVRTCCTEARRSCMVDMNQKKMRLEKVAGGRSDGTHWREGLACDAKLGTDEFNAALRILEQLYMSSIQKRSAELRDVVRVMSAGSSIGSPGLSYDISELSYHVGKLRCMQRRRTHIACQTSLWALGCRLIRAQLHTTYF